MSNVAYIQQADTTQRARANEYTRELQHHPAFTRRIAKDIAEAGVISSLIAIAEADSCAAGALLNEIATAYAKACAESLAKTDNGKLRSLADQLPLNYYIAHVEGHIQTLRNGKK